MSAREDNGIKKTGLNPMDSASFCMYTAALAGKISLVGGGQILPLKLRQHARKVAHDFACHDKPHGGGDEGE